MTRRALIAAVATALTIATSEGRAEPPHAEDRPKAGAGATARRFGEAGDVVLEDVVGARTARAPTPVLALGSALGGLGVGAVGVPASGPSVSAAWLGLSTTKTRAGDTLTVTSARFEPAIDVFVGGGISVGGSLGLELTRTRAEASTLAYETFGVSLDPRVGYAVRFTEDIALWPRARVGLSVFGGPADFHARGYRVGGDAPLVVRVSRHVVVDFGPELTYGVLELGSHGLESRTVHLAGRGGLSLVF